MTSHQPHDCLLNRLFTRRSKKTSKLRATGLCVGNSPVTGELPAQRASNAENVSIWWRHHDELIYLNAIRGCFVCHTVYEVMDLFPWEMITKMAISFLLNVEKNWNSAQINLSSTLNFLLKILFRRNNVHREIHHWNRRWFGAKWHATVPNSVAPVKHAVCKLMYMSQG